MRADAVKLAHTERLACVVETSSIRSCILHALRFTLLQEPVSATHETAACNSIAHLGVNLGRRVTEQLDFDLSSGRVHAERSGGPEGRIVICVHGLSANLRGFDCIVPRLCDLGRQVIAVDLRGRGRSDITPIGTYGLEAHARDLLEIADQLEAAHFEIVGWSLGALIGIMMSNMAPERLRRLVLIDHAAAVDDGPTNAIRTGLARLDARVPDRSSYVEAIRARLPLTRWETFWEQYFAYELVRQVDGSWSPSTNRAACEEDLDGLESPEELRRRWAALTMPTLLVRCTMPLAGGLVVPQRELDAMRGTVGGLRVVEVACNHYEVMTAPVTIDAVADHLGTTTHS